MCLRLDSNPTDALMVAAREAAVLESETQRHVTVLNGDSAILVVSNRAKAGQ